MKRKLLALLMVMCVAVSGFALPGFALQDPVMFSADSVAYGSNQDTLIVKGYFVNTSNKTVLSVADVTIEVTDAGAMVASANVNIIAQKNFSIGVGGAYPWTLVLEAPAKGHSLAAWKAESKVNCNFSTPQDIGTGKKVYYNGYKIDFDVPPAVINGRLMIPARAVFEKMGCIVDWYPESRSMRVNRGGVEVIITVDNTVMTVSGKPVKLDVAATIVSGRTLVPLRAISNALGARVVYGEASEMAVVYE